MYDDAKAKAEARRLVLRQGQFTVEENLTNRAELAGLLLKLFPAMRLATAEHLLSDASHARRKEIEDFTGKSSYQGSVDAVEGDWW